LLLFAEMEKVVTWKAQMELIGPQDPTLGWPSRQPLASATKLRMQLLQQRFALSDEAMEEVPM